jgi:hypothetical protein
MRSGCGVGTDDRCEPSVRVGGVGGHRGAARVAHEQRQVIDVYAG